MNVNRTKKRNQKKDLIFEQSKGDLRLKRKDLSIVLEASQ